MQKNHQDFNYNPFIDSRLEIHPVPEINGWGVFTTQSINENTIVEIAPIIVYPKNVMEMTIWTCRAEGMSDNDLKLDQYTVNWQNDGGLPLGWAGLYNHKDDNNCQFIAYYQLNLIGIQTIKPISAGEQLFVSYGEHWFNAKSGYIKKYPF